MSKASRFCPLCSESMDAAVCPTHGVPTVADGVFEKDDPLLGKTFSNSYKIVDVLGEGAMGRVYRATQINMERPVALKTLHPHLVSDRDLMRRFYREARSASQLLSPHVVRVFDFGVDDETGTPFIAMEILEGSNLGDLIKAEGPLPIDRAARLLIQVSQALREAERKGIVHRDLKPDNVFISNTVDADDDFVKVVDFGIAKVLGSGSGMTSDLTATGKTVGTPQYMAPEQVRGGDVDIRADLYSLGCILHTVLTGSPPFHGDDAMSIMMRHLSAPPPPLPDPLPSGEVPPALLLELHTALLAKSLDDRPAGADVVYRAFRALERQQDITLAKLVETAGKRTKTSRVVPLPVSGRAETVAAGLATRELEGASPSASTKAGADAIDSADAVGASAFGLDADPLDALSSLVGGWPDDEPAVGASSGEADAVPLAMATGAVHTAQTVPPPQLPPPQEEKVPLPLIVLAALVLLGVAGGGAWYFIGGGDTSASAPSATQANSSTGRAGDGGAANAGTANVTSVAGDDRQPAAAPAAAVTTKPPAPVQPVPVDPVSTAVADATAAAAADATDADADADDAGPDEAPAVAEPARPTPPKKIFRPGGAKTAAPARAAQKKPAHTKRAALKKTVQKKTAQKKSAEKKTAQKKTAQKKTTEKKAPAKKAAEPKKASTAVPW